MNANGNQNSAPWQGRPSKRPRITKKSSQAIQAQNPSEAPPQEQPQQVQHFSAGPANVQPPANAATAVQGPVNQAGQANNNPINNLNRSGSVQTPQPNEPVNQNVAPSQPNEPNKPTPDELAKMQYNLLFGPVQKKPEAPSQPKIPSSRQAGAGGNPSLNPVLDTSLWGYSPMDFTPQTQAQPTQSQSVQNQSAEAESAQQAVDDDDIFGEVDFDDFEKQLELELADSLKPVADFNTRN